VKELRYLIRREDRFSPVLDGDSVPRVREVVKNGAERHRNFQFQQGLGEGGDGGGRGGC
jgi:hypothetical protein